MADIQTYLNQIKNAIYGKDVRQAIHDGIEACYMDGKVGAVDLVARQQIAELVAPSGEAPSAAEVTDARIGADTIVYPSLGEANRTQFSGLKSDYNKLSKDGLFMDRFADYNLVFTKYKSLSGGQFVDAPNNRAATEEFYPIYRYVDFVRTNTSYSYEYDLYSDRNEDSYVGYAGWLNTNTIKSFPTAKYFRVVVKRTDDAEIDNLTPVKALSVSNKLPTDRSIQDLTFRNNESEVLLDYTDFEYGNIGRSGNSFTYPNNQADNSDTKVRTREGVTYHLMPNDIVRLKSYSTYGFYFYYIKTDDGTLDYSSSMYVTDLVVKNEGDYVFVIQRRDSGHMTIRNDLMNNFQILVDHGQVYGFDHLFLRGINHAGYSEVAPMNTLPAYKLSKQYGFNFVESDVRLTQDRVPVMLHNATIDETSDGTGNIADMTLEQVRQYDFGSWKSPEYAGTKIPTFYEYIELCRNIQLFPYIELKEIEFTDADIKNLLSIVRRLNMQKKVSWISWDFSLLQKIIKYDREARVGWILSDDLSADNIRKINSLKTGNNRVFVDGAYGRIATVIALATDYNIEAEVFTLDNESYMRNTLSPRVAGVTSNVLNYPEVIKDRDSN